LFSGYLPYANSHFHLSSETGVLHNIALVAQVIRVVEYERCNLIRIGRVLFIYFRGIKIDVIEFTMVFEMVHLFELIKNRCDSIHSGIRIGAIIFIYLSGLRIELIQFTVEF